MKFKSDKNYTLLEAIKEKMGYSSNSKERNIIKRGSVKVDDKVVKIPSIAITVNQIISTDNLISNKKNADKTPKTNYKPAYEDDHFIAFIKPSGLLSVSTETKIKTEKNFRDQILNQYQVKSDSKIKLLPINRIDRLYSGIMLFAKSAKSEIAVREKWETNTKRYYAFVEGDPKNENGNIESHLKQNRIGRVYSAPKSEYGKLCEINYRVLYRAEKYSLLKVDVIAERKNSIRAQLSENKWPIVGDKDYKGHPSPIKRFGMHLFSLAFYHPFENKIVEIKTPLPTPFKMFFKRKPKKLKE
jgi:23S rRNA pseudouridine1911/1915/1917 synthase